jgi:asparagine synthase (glutamine-hydrolysing)
MGNGRPSANRARLAEFLAGLPPQGRRDAFFEGVKAVPAASVFELDLTAARAVEPAFRSFWDLRAFVAADAGGPTFPEASGEIRRRLEASVAMQSTAAVPVGCLLSGGLDTSCVVRSMADSRRSSGGAPVSTYSIVYSEPDMSELPFIWAVARQGSVQSHTYELTPRQVWHDVDAVVRTQGQPLLGQELIAQYRAYALAREHGSIVVLDGQGADELLAGMPLYASAWLDELLTRGRVRQFAAELWTDAKRRGRTAAGAALLMARWAL